MSLSSYFHVLLIILTLIIQSTCDHMFLCDTLTCDSKCTSVGDGKSYSADELECPVGKSLTCCLPYCYCCVEGTCPYSSCEVGEPRFQSNNCEYPTIRNGNIETPRENLSSNENNEQENSEETASAWSWPENFF